jgi:hypothetical protein
MDDSAVGGKKLKLSVKDMTKTGKSITNNGMKQARKITKTGVKTVENIDWTMNGVGRPLAYVGGIVALVGAGYAIWRIVENRKASATRRKLLQSASMSENYVDMSSEDSFPASDSPSFTSMTSLGRAH